MADLKFSTAILHPSQFAQVTVPKLEATGGLTIEVDRRVVAVGRLE